MKNSIPDPDDLKHQTRARHRHLCFHRGDRVLIRVFGQILADKAIAGLHDLAANLPNLDADEPEVFNDVNLALMAAGAPTMNTTEQGQLFDGETFRCAREVGRWLCMNRLKVTLDPLIEHFKGRSFEQAVDLELKRVDEGLGQPVSADEGFVAMVMKVAAGPRSTSVACFGVGLALLKAKRFGEAISVAVVAYQSTDDDPETWADCSRFMELVGKASTERLMVNDLPDWSLVMLIGEGADLASVP